jgi:hypothetical protein
MTIKGGTIYVDNGQALTIQGATLNNMWISPDEIVVAQGGALTIDASTHTNVLTNIFVDGGTLTINAGAKIQGNIYAYNNATVDIKGTFTLDSPKAHASDREHDGLIIYGPQTVGAIFEKTDKNGTVLSTITISAPGKLTVPNVLPSISGTAGRAHLAGGTWIELVTGTHTPLSGAALFLCEGHDSKVGICRHFDGTPGSGAHSSTWIIGPYGNN